MARSTSEERQVLAALRPVTLEGESKSEDSVLQLFERSRASLDLEGVDPDASRTNAASFVLLAEAALARGEAEVCEASIQTYLSLGPAHDQVSLLPGTRWHRHGKRLQLGCAPVQPAGRAAPGSLCLPARRVGGCRCAGL